MNILVPISFNFQIRFLIRTGLLYQISTFCNPVILLFWNEKDLINELKASGFNCYILSAQKPDKKYQLLKKRIDIHYQKSILRSPTFKIRRGMERKRMTRKKKIKSFFKSFQYHSLFYDKTDFQTDIKNLQEHITQLEYFHTLDELIEEIGPKAVLTSAPFLYTEELVCRVADQRDISIFYTVLSFDNPTTRGYIPFTIDHFFVWNRLNKEELLRSQPLLSPDQISISGPAQFDFYYNNQFIKEERVWRKEKKIPDNRPIILYGANAKVWVPNEYLIVKSIDEAITRGEIQRNAIILLRPHPTDSYTDWEYFAKTRDNVYIEKSIEKNQTEDKMYNKFSNFTLDDIVNLCSSLAHSSVHISYASTLTLDGSCFDKPQICPYFAPDHSIYNDVEIRSLYHTEHYNPIRLSGAIDLPENIEELIKSINLALIKPKLKAKKRTELLNKMITYLDGNATKRIATQIRKLTVDAV